MKEISIRCTKPLLSNSADTMMRSSKKLMSWFRRANRTKSSGIASFSFYLECDEIDAGGVLLLMDSAFRINRLGWPVHVSGQGNALQNLRDHLNHYLTPKQDRPKYPSDSVYLLRELQTRNEMVEELEKWAKFVQEGSGASDEDVAGWTFQISEVVTNSFQHSATGEAMLIAGKVDKARRSVNLAALDFGETIPATIQRNPRCPGGSKVDGERIKFSCRQGITAQSERANQGRGLFDLVETVKRNGGTMQILSRNGLFHLTNQRRCCRNLPPFSGTVPVLNGTLVSVTLKF